MKQKIFILSILFLSASCSAFSTPPIGGMVKTVNGGADWQFVNALKDNPKASLVTMDVSILSLDPQNRQTVFAGAYNGGLYKSEDAAAHWSRILSRVYVYDMAVHPADSKIIYVAGAFGGNGEVVKTVDGGASWQEVYNEGSSQSVVRDIALNPSAPDQMIIGTESGTVIKSIDGGKDWQLVKNFGERISKVLWQNNAIYVLVKSRGLYKSVDGGTNFTSLTLSIIQKSTNDFFPDDSNTLNTLSQVAVSFTNPSLIYMTTNKGLYKTTDEGKTWKVIPLPIKTDSTITKAVAIAKGSDSIVYTSIGSTIYKTLDSANTWQTQKVATNGFINYILVDPQLPQIAYAGIFNGSQ